MDCVLKINNLSYKNILKNLNIELHNNTFNILIGKNCCGKTTLINSIIGLNKYDGRIDLFISKEDLSVVTEKNVLLSGTVIHNLVYPLLNLDIKEDKARKQVYSLSKKFGIDNILHKEIQGLNRSERKLVEILVALVTNPKFIIIDDSLDDLIYSYRLKVLNYLKEISKKSCVLILTSNSDYLEFSDNIYVMNEGIIEKETKYSQLFMDEKLLNKCKIKIPFIIDLSNKLKFYNLINKDYTSDDELISDIWK